jgi:hypothetical protein
MVLIASGPRLLHESKGARTNTVRCTKQKHSFESYFGDDMKSGSVSGTSMYRIIVALVVAAVLASENQEPMARSIKRRDDPLLKMGGILSKVYAEYMTGEENINSSALVNNVSDRLVHSDGSVSVDVVAFGTGTELQELVDELSLIGFRISSTFYHIASGKIPVSALGGHV